MLVMREGYLATFYKIKKLNLTRAQYIAHKWIARVTLPHVRNIFFTDIVKVHHDEI